MTPEQAQTVAEIRERHKLTSVDNMGAISYEESGAAHFDRATLLQIIDSQAFEIARLHAHVAETEAML
jgi:hypothetical protein